VLRGVVNMAGDHAQAKKRHGHEDQRMAFDFTRGGKYTNSDISGF